MRETIDDIKKELRSIGKHINMHCSPWEKDVAMPTVKGMPLHVYFSTVADRIDAAERIDK